MVLGRPYLTSLHLRGFDNYKVVSFVFCCSTLVLFGRLYIKYSIVRTLQCKKMGVAGYLALFSCLVL